MTRRLSRRALLRAVAGGAALLAVGAAAPPRITARETRAVELVAGWNSATWCGPDTPIADALAGLPLRAAWGWEVAEQRWQGWAPGPPSPTLTELRHGQPLWFELTDAATWRQPQAAGAFPPPIELPVGWSYLGWSGLHESVWTAFGEDPWGPVVEARRWWADDQRWYAYQPGESAQQLFAVLHPGDAVWVRTRVAGATWNPASGIQPGDLASRVVPGEITYYHPSLAGGPMYCPPWNPYDPQDPQIAAAVSWPCGTRLRLWRGERSVDVIVQDTGLLGVNHVDLSEAAFQRLATLPEGRVPVLIEVLAGPE